MTNIITLGNDARNGLLRGVQKISGAVKVTLGPSGRNVVIKNNKGVPQVTKDGVTVAKSIILSDNLEEAGARLVKEVAMKTAGSAGDGTTTATILAEAIYSGGMKMVGAGANSISVQRGIDMACRMVVGELTAMSHPIDTEATVKMVALVSSNWDDEIAENISQAVNAVGLTGIITIETTENVSTTLDFRQGLHWERGWVHPNFALSGGVLYPKVEYQGAMIIVTDKKLSTLKDIIPVLDKLAKLDKPIAIIADSIEGEALAAMMLNHLKGLIRVVAINAPGFGAERKNWLQDIAAMCECQVFSDELGVTTRELDTRARDIIGVANIIVTAGTTTLIRNSEDTVIFDNHIASLNSKMAASDSDYTRDGYKERIANLTSNVAIIRIGGSNESVVMERKDRYDDALSACLAAIESGIVIGGGAALARASSNISGMATDVGQDVAVGIRILLDACNVPLLQLADNAGTNGHQILASILGAETANRGYDFVRRKYVDMMEAGIIDPLKVTRTALENAAAIGGLLLTTEAVITPDPNGQ